MRGCAVSTHSRLKAAGQGITLFTLSVMVSTHSRLKAAGIWTLSVSNANNVSTHSRLKAAGDSFIHINQLNQRFNTQPPKGGWFDRMKLAFTLDSVSTHSRLKAAGPLLLVLTGSNSVSTHSRLKAAGQQCATYINISFSFNTQPPKGGWWVILLTCSVLTKFQHTAA